MQIPRLIFAARACGPGHLHTRSQTKAIEFAGNVMRRVVRSRRAGAPALESVRSEILDDLTKALDAGRARIRLLRDHRDRKRDEENERSFEYFQLHLLNPLYSSVLSMVNMI